METESKKAYINSIQRFSLNDGPGIRTVVFFTGCNMHCVWCHNPETIPVCPTLMFYKDKCKGCGKCFKVCPVGAHILIDGIHEVDRNACINCGICASVCNSNALVMSGRSMTIGEVMDEILQDKVYYKQSSGGVTLSGGEALLQFDFAVALAKACRKENVYVAVETNMGIPFTLTKPLFELLDLIMFDIKIFDDEQHKKWIGTSNARVLENAKKVSKLGKPLIVRTPIIPGATDSMDNLKAIADFVKELPNVKYYELLNFNPLGSSKYEAIDADNYFRKSKPYSDDHMKEIKKELHEYSGLEIKIG